MSTGDEFGGLAVTDSRSKNRYKKKNQIYTEFQIHYTLLTPKTLGGFPPPSLTQTTPLYVSILHPTHATFPPPLKPTKSPPNSLHLSAFLPVLPLFLLGGLRLTMHSSSLHQQLAPAARRSRIQPQRVARSGGGGCSSERAVLP